MTENPKRLYAGIFLIAFSALALEITLARFLSVVTWYHLAFFAVSVAMLGMTAGAVRVYVRPADFDPERRDASLRNAARHYAIDVLLMLALLCLAPMELKNTWKPTTTFLFLFEIKNSWLSPLTFLLVTLGCALPFYQAGIITSALLTRFALPTNRLYAADLAGAALGCLFVLAALPALDAPGVFMICAGIGALAMAFFRREPTRPQRLTATALFALSILLALAHTVSPMKISPRYVKGKLDDQSLHIADRWNTISRIIVNEGTWSRPQLWGPSPLAPTNHIASFYMNIDGEAATVVRKFEQPSDIEHLRYDVTNVGHLIQTNVQTACIIGVGGGRDVQSALLFGCRDVTGIEINPIFLDLLSGLFGKFAGLAGRPDVHLHLDDARSWLTTSTNTFDFLQMSLIDTWASTGAGAFSLSENGLYTVEAWQTFFRRLSPDGLFTVSRWHSRHDLGETGRLVSLAVESLFQFGVDDPSRHLALVTADTCCTLLVARRPFSDAAIQQLIRQCEHFRYTLAFYPGHPPAHDRLRAMLAAHSSGDLRAAVGLSDLNYDPPTDDNPYFFNMLRLSNLTRYKQEDFHVVRGNMTATLTLLALLGCLAAVAIATVILPLALRRKALRTADSNPRFLPGAIYFSLLGAGFMLAEIALMQRLSVFLGHPVYAMGVLLFTLIASTGVGSYLSGNFDIERGRWRIVAPIAAAVLILAMTIIVPHISHHFMAAPLVVRCLIAVVLLAPLGLLLGGFFPAGMRLATRAGITETPWYWALNGVFGVLCSALAVLISIYGSISANLLIAAACYALTLPCLRALAR